MSGSNVVPFPAPAPPPPQATPLPPPVAAPVPPAPPAAQSAPALRLPPPSSPNESDDTAAFVAQFVKKQSPPAPPADAGDQTPPGQVPSAQVQLPPGQPGPSSPDESDDTAAFVAQFVHAQQAPATANMVAAQGSNPDKTAQAMATAAKLGLPVPAVEADPQHYADLAKLSDDRQVVASDPVLQNWIKANPTNAKLAIDDIAQLGVIGRLSRGLDEGRLQYQEAGVQAKIGAENLFGGASTANLNLLDAIKAQLALGQGQDELAEEARAQTALAQRGNQPLSEGRLTEHGFAPQAGEYAATAPGVGVYGDVAQGAGQFLGATAPIAKEAALAVVPFGLGRAAQAYQAARAVGAAGEAGLALAPAVARSAGAGVGAAARVLAPAALTAMVGNQVEETYGQAYNDMSGAKDAYGREIPEVTKQFVAAGAGLLAGGITMAGGGVQFGKLLNLPKLQFVKDVAVEAAKIPGLQHAFQNFVGGAMKAGVANVLMGMGLNAVQALAPEAGKVITSPNFDDIANDPAKYHALKREVVSGWEQNLALGLGLHVPAAGASLMYDAARAAASGRAYTLWSGTMDAAAQSKTRLRAPSAFERLMQGHSGESVYVNGDVLAKFYQDMGSEPGAKNDPFAQVVPDMKDQLDRASLTGGVVEIPRAGFAAKLAGSKVDYDLRPHVKLQADGMSAIEAQAFITENPDMFAPFDLEKLAASGGEELGPGHKFTVANVAENSDNPLNPMLTMRDEAGQEFPVSAEDFNKFMQARQATITRAEGGGERAGTHANTLNEGDVVQTLEGQRADIRADVMRQLQATGQTEDQARTNAALMVSFFDTLGKNLGLSPEMLYRLENLRIQREREYLAGPGEYNDLDAAIDALRAGRAAPSDREIYGPSLLEYLSTPAKARTIEQARTINPRRAAGGLVDTGGNLLHMGASDWHKEKPGRSKLINPKGMTLDDAALEAWEAGYFPDKQDRPTINDLLDAIHDELRGEPRHRELDAGAYEKEQFRNLMSDIDRLANESGIDLKTASNAEIKKMLLEAAPPAAEGGRTFEQKQGTRPRGAITFTEGGKLISLFRDADASTFPHEAAHLFLDVMDRAVRMPEATPEMQADMANLRKWLGVGDDEALAENVAAHEKFARGFETYMKEGKAPSEELRGVFAKLAAWITRVYQRLKQAGQPINDDVRGIMDRMLATRQAVDEAQFANGTMTPALKDAAMAGMTGTQFNLYLAKIAREKNDLYDRVLARVMKTEEVKRTREWKEAREAETPHAQFDVLQGNPGIRTWSYFAKAHDPAMPEKEIPRTKLSAAAVKDILGPRMSGLPAGVLSRGKATKGEAKVTVVHPDDVAPAFGYSTGRQMLEDMISANAGRQAASEALGRDMSMNDYLNRLVSQNLDERLGQMFGDPLKDGTIEQIAQEEASKASAIDLISTDLRALAKRNGEEPPFTVAQATEWIKQSFLKTSIRQAIKPAPYLKAAQKAARDAEIALLRGDVVKALKAKQVQMMAQIAAGEAQGFAKMYASTVADWKKLGKTVRLPKIDPRFADQIHAVLDTIGIPIARDADELRRGIAGQDLADFVNDRQEQGWQIEMPFFLQNVVGNSWVRPGSMFYGDFGTHDFMLTSDLITSLKEVGKQVNEIVVGNKRENFNDTIDRIVDEASAMKDVARDFSNQSLKGAEYAMSRGRHASREVFASLRRIENLLVNLGPENQTLARAVMDGLKIASSDEAQFRDVFGKSFERLTESLSDEWKARDPKEKVDVAAMPVRGNTVWTRDALLMAALNCGNMGENSNFSKLVEGMGWDGTAVLSALNEHLTQDDWKYVQGIWDIMEEFKPYFDDLQRRMTGVGITYVKPTPLETPFGRLRGGYFPVMYDSVEAATAAMREKIEQNASPEADQGPYERGSLAARTFQGAMINRTGYVGPLTFDPNAFVNRFSQMLHDLAYREAVMNAWKILNDPRIKAMMTDKLGPEYQKLFNPWLRDVAGMSGEMDNQIKFWDNMSRHLRINASSMYLGFNWLLPILHGSTGFVHALNEADDKLRFVKAAAGLLNPANFDKRWKFITDNSIEVRDKLKTVDVDTRQSLKTVMRMDSGFKKLTSKAQVWSSYLLSRVIAYSSGALWDSEYSRMMEQGMDHDQASLQADRKVRLALGGTHYMDQAAVFRNEGLVRQLVWFGGFYNTILNRQLDALQMVRRGDTMKGIATGITYLLLPALLAVGVKGYLGGQKSDNDSWMDYALKTLGSEVAAPIPMVNAIASMWAHHLHDLEAFGPQEAMNDIVQTFRDGYNYVENGAVSPFWIEHAAETVGYFSPEPLPGIGQAGKSAQYLWDWYWGEIDPKTLGEVAKGLLRGPQKAH